jgi:hypothetical protein
MLVQDDPKDTPIDLGGKPEFLASDGAGKVLCQFGGQGPDRGHRPESKEGAGAQSGRLWILFFGD